MRLHLWCEALLSVSILSNALDARPDSKLQVWHPRTARARYDHRKNWRSRWGRSRSEAQKGSKAIMRRQPPASEVEEHGEDQIAHTEGDTDTSRLAVDSDVGKLDQLLEHEEDEVIDDVKKELRREESQNAIITPILNAIANGFRKAIKKIIPANLKLTSLTSKKVTLSHWDIPRADIGKLDLGTVKAKNISLPKLNLGIKGKTAVKMDGIVANGLALNGLALNNAKATDLELSGLKLTNTAINNLQANKLSLKGLDLQGSVGLSAVVMKGVDVKGKASLNGVKMKNADIQGKAQFTEMKLHNLDLAGKAQFTGLGLGKVKVKDIEFGPYKSIVAVLAYIQLILTMGILVLALLCCMVTYIVVRWAHKKQQMDAKKMAKSREAAEATNTPPQVGPPGHEAVPDPGLFLPPPQQ